MALANVRERTIGALKINPELDWPWCKSGSGESFRGFARQGDDLQEAAIAGESVCKTCLARMPDNMSECLMEQWRLVKAQADMQTA